MNFVLVMKTGESELVAIGPLDIEYQAAMLRDDIEDSAGWTTVGIARVLTEGQARARITGGPGGTTMAGSGRGDGPGPC